LFIIAAILIVLPLIIIEVGMLLLFKNKKPDTKSRFLGLRKKQNKR